MFHECGPESTRLAGGGPADRRAIDAILRDWARSEVRLLVVVHPDCHPEIQVDKRFCAMVEHCVRTTPADPAYRAGVRPLAGWFASFRVAQLSREHTIAALRTPESADCDTFLRPEFFTEGKPVTHIMILVPREILMARITAHHPGIAREIVTNNLSVTNTRTRVALINESRLLGTFPPADPRLQGELFGYYQRYLIIHELMHSFGAGHPTLASVRRTPPPAGDPWAPVMLQLTVVNEADLAPKVEFSLWDLIIQPPDHLELMRQQAAWLAELTGGDVPAARTASRGPWVDDRSRASSAVRPVSPVLPANLVRPASPVHPVRSSRLAGGGLDSVVGGAARAGRADPEANVARSGLRAGSRAATRAASLGLHQIQERRAANLAMREPSLAGDITAESSVSASMH